MPWVGVSSTTLHESTSTRSWSGLRPAGHDLGPSGIDSPLSLAAIEPTKNAPKRRRASLVAAAVNHRSGPLGARRFLRRDWTRTNPKLPLPRRLMRRTDPPRANPAVFPIVGDHAEPGDGASFSMIGSNDPERISALVARRDGATLSDGLWITASREVTDDSSPADTAPERCSGKAGVRGPRSRCRRVDRTVRHSGSTRSVAGDPTLEVAGVDALAFMHAAGPDAILVSGTGRDGAVMSLQIGELPEDYDMIVEPVREPLGTIAASIGVENTATTEGNYVEVGLSNPPSHERCLQHHGDRRRHQRAKRLDRLGSRSLRHVGTGARYVRDGRRVRVGRRVPSPSLVVSSSSTDSGGRTSTTSATPVF